VASVPYLARNSCCSSEVSPLRIGHLQAVGFPWQASDAVPPVRRGGHHILPRLATESRTWELSAGFHRRPSFCRVSTLRRSIGSSIIQRISKSRVVKSEEIIYGALTPKDRVARYVRRGWYDSLLESSEDLVTGEECRKTVHRRERRVRREDGRSARRVPSRTLDAPCTPRCSRSLR